MKTMELIGKTREYLDYLEGHVLSVQKAWAEVQNKCRDMEFMRDAGIRVSIADAIGTHDMSKLSEQEFIQYRKAFFPVDGEPKYDMSGAWDHHKVHNSHHWQNWAGGGPGDGAPWECNCVHMVVDWMAMGYKFGDTAQSYYEKNKTEINIPDCAVWFIYEIFKRVYAPSRPTERN